MVIYGLWNMYMGFYGIMFWRVLIDVIVIYNEGFEFLLVIFLVEFVLFCKFK